MNRFILLILFATLHLCHQTLQAQVTPPCPTPPPPGAPACASTCVYCNFDGYMGNNAGFPSGGNTVCGQITIHNDQWFGFVAGTESITINIATSNCMNGDGLQAAFFANCQDDALVCNGGSGGGGGQPLTLSYSNFIPGQTYYLMIDGWVADVCDYEIEVLDGSVSPPAPAQPAVPQGPTVVCPGAEVVYTIPEAYGAGYYQWTAPAGSKINGGNTNNVTLPAPDGTSITVTFGNAGGTVCVKVGNACSTPLMSCLNVINQPIPPTIKPDVVVCFEDLPFTWDEQPFTTYSTPGTYNLTSTPYDSYLGCDSLVKQKIVLKSQIKTNIGTLYTCEGSCLVVNGNTYCNTGGPFQEVLESFQGCDSIVQFNVITIPANAVIGPVQMINCNNPSLTLTSTGSTTAPTASYTWTNATWTPIGNQTTQMVNTGGTYNLIVTNTLGTASCKDTATVSVPANLTPPGASVNGGNITCTASSVTLMASSPTNSVNYQWSGPGITPANQNLQNPVVSQTGSYTVTVTNPVNGCSSTATATVSGDNTPPQVSATGGTLTCAQQTLSLSSSTNASQASYSWSGPCINASNQNNQNPVVNCTGTFTVVVTNTANGCTNTATATVMQDVNIPTADAGADQAISCQQTSVVLNGSGNTGGAPPDYLWTGPGINAGNQNNPTPTVDQAGTYILTVTNSANGCSSQDTVVVTSSIIPPVANAGADNTITCATQTVALGGAGSSQGPDYSALWTGPGINAGNQNQYNPVVNQSGTYVLTVTNTMTGCTSTDTSVIAINITPPVVDAGMDTTLTCSTPNGIALSGSGSPANVSYLWMGQGIGANNATLQNPVVTVPDTYTLQVTDPANGCTATDQVLVMQDANLPAANAGPDLVLNCSVNAVNINASGSASGPDITYQWSGPGINAGNATIQNPSNIGLPGNYTVTVTNTSNNCVNTDVVVISIDTVAPAASAGADLVLNCYNNATDTLDASASSNGPGFGILWSGPGITPANQNDIMPVVDVAGVYTLQITNNGNMCSSSSQVNVSEDILPPVADAGNDPTIDCVNSNTTIGGNSSSGADFTYLWNGPGINAGNQSDYQPVVSVPGAYTLVVTDTGNGCTATDAMNVNSDAVYPIADAGADGLITCTQANIVLDGAASSSGANIQIDWSGPDITPANQNLVSPAVALPGTYILSVTNTQNSCISTDTVLVDENTTPPVASAGQDLHLDCQLTSVVLDGMLSDTGAMIVYMWNGPAINAGNQNEQSPAIDQPGVYTLLVTDAENGCTAQDDVAITQDTVAPIANAGADFTLNCAQSSLAIDGAASSSGPDFTYLWQGPDINTANFDLQNPVVSDSGTYILIVTNTQNNCTATDEVYVALDADPPAADAGVDQTLTCASDTLQLDGSLSASGAAITYSWSGPGIVQGQQNNASPDVFAPGNYTLTVLNTLNGCSQTDIVIVGSDFIPPVADAGDDQVLTCANSATGVTLQSGSSSTGPDFTLLWSGPGINTVNQGQASPTVLTTGTYTLLITNTVNGCTSTDIVIVGQDQNLPVADAGPDQTITCTDTEVVLDASGSSSPGSTLLYEWSGPDINAGNQNQQLPSVSLSGTYTLTVTNPDSGCQASDEVEVLLDNQPPQIQIATDTITCDDPQGVLSVTSSLPNSTYSWSGPGINPGNMALATLPVGEPGLYNVTVTAPNGCTQSNAVQMFVDADFPEGAAEGAELNCYNSGMATISGQVITPGASYSWSGPGNFQSDQLQANVTIAGNYVFTIVSPNGCPREIEVEVTQDFALPQVVASVSELLDCNTNSLTINTSGTSVGPVYTYAWSTAGGNIASGANGLAPVVDEPGTYTLVVSNNINGCKDSTSVLVAIDPSVPTAFDLNIQNIRCFGESNGFISVGDVAGGTEPFIFSIDGNTGSQNNQFTGLTAGSYTLSMEDANGCLLDTVVMITEPGELLVDLGPDIEVQLGEEATVLALVSNSTPLQSLSWNYAPNCDSTTSDCLEFSYVPTQSYRHAITVIDSNGCVARDQVYVIVKKNRLVYVPNIFHPGSSDPLNYQLMIQGGTGVAKIRQWQIFDRWGSSVFVAEDFLPNDPDVAWDGRVRGDDANPGVYTWFAEIEFVDGEVELFKGDVTVLR
ncbi:MAG: hypothetical protein H6575_10400 [Lewinellaceae bacterium]|nr:hypothetical protein [Lewinellaceae bacterium]